MTHRYLGASSCVLLVFVAFGCGSTLEDGDGGGNVGGSPSGPTTASSGNSSSPSSSSGSTGSTSTGTAPTCSDGVANGTETDIDCGGPVCEPCHAGKTCNGDADCESTRCFEGSCASACSIAGLVIYYPLDGDTSDASGNDRDATPRNVQSATGRFGGGYSFDAKDSALLVTGTGQLTGARTLCAWVKPHVTTGLGQPIFSGGQAGAADFFSLQTSTPGGTCSVAPSNALFHDHWLDACIVPSSLTVPDEAWSLVCLSNDGNGTDRFSVDGTAIEAAGDMFGWSYADIAIGANLVGGTTTKTTFSGVIDEVTVWSHDLDTGELDQLWGQGAGCVP